MAAFRLALREPHSNAIGALRLALSLLCGDERVNIMLKEY
jgi:hypothetical protein